MNNLVKFAALTLAVGTVLASGAVHAVVVNRTLAANAPAHCQAFHPGPTNTVRNRVVGSENAGALMNVSCVFEKPIGESSTPIQYADLWFSNNNTSGTVSINCTMLTGYQGEAGAVMVNKTVVVSPGVQGRILFEPADMGPGNDLLGVNCALPTGAVINDTYILWQEDNGVAAAP